MIRLFWQSPHQPRILVTPDRPGFRGQYYGDTVLARLRLARPGSRSRTSAYGSLKSLSLSQARTRDPSSSTVKVCQERVAVSAGSEARHVRRPSFATTVS